MHVRLCSALLCQLDRKPQIDAQLTNKFCCSSFVQHRPSFRFIMPWGNTGGTSWGGGNSGFEPAGSFEPASAGDFEPAPTGVEGFNAPADGFDSGFGGDNEGDNNDAQGGGNDGGCFNCGETGYVCSSLHMSTLSCSFSS